jgi:hypothetical protein
MPLHDAGQVSGRMELPACQAGVPSSGVRQTRVQIMTRQTINTVCANEVWHAWAASRKHSANAGLADEMPLDSAYGLRQQKYARCA